MITKKFKIWSVMTLVTMVLLMMVACGDVDNDENGLSYTESEIVDLLTGTWEITGEFKISKSNNESQIGTYNGTMEFREDKTFIYSITAIATGGLEDNEATELVKGYLGKYVRGYHASYTILKKNGKNYIVIGKYNYDSNHQYEKETCFEIVSLKINTFLLVCDQEMNNCYLYMTLLSK